MKKFTIKGVLDGIRGSVSQQPKAEVDFIEETLRPEHFQVMKTVRHGFPYQPTAMAFDPVQRILAIGTKSGSLRILGRPGVDCHVTHNSDQAVIQILFLVNEGALVSVCADDRLHLWNLRQKMPDIVHSLAFQKERITYCHLPFQSKWLYIGTERGNIHVVNIESFVLSGYVINWNKAIELSRKTHPGAVVHLSDNPIDNSKLLIGFETGSIVFWDLRTRTAEARFQHTEALRAVAWHHDGKQFMCSHTDGSLTTWNIKSPSKPMSILFPHAKPNKDGKPETCKAISKLEWKSQKGGEMFLIFCGGLPLDRAGRTPSITVIHGKTTTVLEMEHTVVDFITLCESPWQSDFQDPYAIVVLLHNDLVVVDLTSPGYLCFENPYPMDLHESPVTCCMYLADCPSDLVPAFYSVGSRAHKRAGFSEKAWPISGGAWGTNTCSYPDIIITGHADGSLKFWDASAVLLQILYKLKTAKIFEKPKAKSLDSMEEDPFAIQQIAFCPESRLLCIANVSSHVILFRFSRSESMIEVPVLEIPIIYEVDDVVDYSPDYEYPPRPSIGGASHHGSYASSSEENKKPSLETFIPTRVKSGPQKRAPGFQPCIVCQTPWIEGAPPGQITSLSINSSYGLMAYGNESGLVIVDVFQKSCLLNIGSPDLYGSSDPYQRIPRSPKKNQCDTNSGESAMDRCRSPTSDQPPKLVPVGDDPNEGQSYMVPASSDLSLPPPVVSTVPLPSSLTSQERISTVGASIFYPLSSSSPPKPKPRRHKILKSVSMDPDFSHSVDPLFGKRQTQNLQCPSTNGNADKTGDEHCPSAVQSAVLGTVTAPSPEADTKTRWWIDPQTVDTVKLGETYKRQRSYSWKGFTFRKKSTASKCRQHPVTSMIEPSGEDRGAKTTTNNPSGHDGIERGPLADDGGRGFRGGREKDAIGIWGGKANVIDLRAEGEERGGSFSPMNGVCLSPTTGKQGQQAQQPQQQQGPQPPPTQPQQQQLQLQTLQPQQPQQQPLPTAATVAASAKKLYTPDLKRTKSQEKIDNSFSRSRSSSMSSLENITSEAIQCLVFADSYTRKADCSTCPTLWVGTSLGSVLVIILNLPPTGDLRQTQPVIVSPSDVVKYLGLEEKVQADFAAVLPIGTIFRLKGAILTMAFLDCNGALIHYQFENWKDINKLDIKERERERPRTPLRSPHNPTTRVSPTTSSEMGDRQFVVLASEKQACVVALPSQTCAFKVQVADVSFVVKAEVISVRDSVCLACYIANGHLATYSLPSLRPLMDIEFVPLIDLSYQTSEQGTIDPMISIWGKQLYHSCETEQIARTFCFSNYGHGMYLCSPCEIQKFTICVGFCDNLNEMLGDLFLPCETPEPPKEGFFKNLFGGGPRALDREELFGEASGKASRSVAKHIPGNVNVEHLNSKTVGVAGEVAKAHKSLIERGENLSHLEDRTAQMMSEAEVFSKAAHQIMLKNKDKKWYQF